MLVVALALAGYLYEHNRTGSIYHPHARFIPEPTPTLPTQGPETLLLAALRLHQEHTRFFPAPATLHPPFKQLWVHNAHALLEFPPVIYGDRIFQLADNGVLSAIDKQHRQAFWTRAPRPPVRLRAGRHRHVVYATVLSSEGAAAVASSR